MANDKKQPKGGSNIVAQVASRINDASYVLVALSKNPSIDEMTAALGLTMIINKMGKHSTAIFSGKVPNIIEFLEPEKTFESNTNSLRDFIIALDKEKADHLRYKIEGDYVKVFITPYKTTIEEKDIEFSHGDYNVDLVVALNVSNSTDLDSALTEYGRIMHDATSINISAAVPGKFADLEWGNPNASSVSEMICLLSSNLETADQPLLDKTISTSLLAGIFAATNRFSNERTSSSTMQAAAKLMNSGADQQLISSNVPVDILTSIEEPVVDAPAEPKEEVATPKDDESTKEEVKKEQPEEKSEPKDPTKFTINHDSSKKPNNKLQFDSKKENEAKKAAEEAARKAEAEERKRKQEEKAAAEKERTEREKREREEEMRREIEERLSKRTTTSGIVNTNDEVKHLSDNQDILDSQKKSLFPNGQEIRPPEPPKDYSSMMTEELRSDGINQDDTTLKNIVIGNDQDVSQAPSGVVIPDEAPALSAPVSLYTEPVAQEQVPAIDENTVVPDVQMTADQPVVEPVMDLPMPNDSILPPPAMPLEAFTTEPMTTMPAQGENATQSQIQYVETPVAQEYVETTPVQQSAQAFAQELQGAVEYGTQNYEPVMPQPIDASAIDASAFMSPATPTMAAPAAEAPVQEYAPVTPTVLEVTPAQEAQAPYQESTPVDPGMFQIPGMQSE